MDIMTYPEAAKVLGVSRPTITKWVKEGKLEAAGKVGKTCTVTKSSVDVCLNDEKFQMALKIAQKKHPRKLNSGNVEQKQLFKRIENLENKLPKLRKRIEVLEAENKEIRECLENKHNKKWSLFSKRKTKK